MLLAAATTAATARAHIVVSSRTVRALATEAELVVRARIVARRAVAARSSEGGGGGGGGGVDRPVVEAEVLEVLVGQAPSERIAFVQHGHGVATFAPGGEHLLFLQPIARSRELDALGEAGVVAWVSLQEHDDAHPIEPGTRDALLGAVRAYARMRTAPTPEARREAAREATRRLLTSGDPLLAASAVRDLVASPGDALVSAAEVPALEPVLDDPGTAIGVRVGLLVQLERRGLLDGRPRWRAWLAGDAPTATLVPALRAAGRDPRPEIRALVVARITSERERVAAAAAEAAGRPGDDAVVAPLERALAHPSARVRQAAIRGLGRTATPGAIAALERAAEASPHPTTRRLAAAEVRKRRATGE